MFVKLKNSKRKIKGNLVPPFENTGWIFDSRIKDTVKNGYEISFNSPAEYLPVYYNMPIKDIAGKMVSLSVRIARGSIARTQLSWRIGSTWTHKYIDGVGKLEAIIVPTNIVEARVYAQAGGGSTGGQFYFKNIQLEEGAVVTDFTEYVEVNKEARHSFSEHICSSKTMNYWTAGKYATTGSSNGYAHVWNHTENALQVDVATNSSHGHSFLLPVDRYNVYQLTAKAKTSMATNQTLYSPNVLWFNENKAMITSNNPVEVISTTWNSSLSTSYRDIELKFRLKNIPSNAKYFTFQINRNGTQNPSVDYILLKDLKLVIYNNSKMLIDNSEKRVVQRGVKFKDATSHVLVPYHKEQDLTNDFTVQVEFKTSSTTTQGILTRGFGKNGDARYSPYAFWIWSSKINFFIGDDAGWSNVQAPMPTLNKWTRVTATLKDTKARIYVDGIFIAESTITRTPYNNGSPVVLGSITGSSSQLLGEIKSYKLYGRAITDQEVVNDIVDESVIESYDLSKYNIKLVYKNTTLPREVFKNTNKAIGQYPFNFSRSSAEIYDGAKYRINQPRVVDNGGLLVEESTTNVSVRPSKWTERPNLTISKHFEMVNGESTYLAVAPNTGVTSNTLFRQSYSYTVGSARTATFYVKKYNHRYVAFRIHGSGSVGGSQSVLDFDTGTTYNNSNGEQAITAKKLDNDWYKVVATNTSPLANSPYVGICLPDNTVGSEVAKLDGRGVYIADAHQLEGKGYATSYTPVSRPVEKVTFPKGILDTNGGSIEFTFIPSTDWKPIRYSNTGVLRSNILFGTEEYGSGQHFRMWSWSGSENHFGIDIDSPAPVVRQHVDITMNPNDWKTGIPIKIKWVWSKAEGTNKLYINDILKGTKSGITAFNDLSNCTLKVGGGSNSDESYNGIFKDFIVKDSLGKVKFQF